MHIIHVPRRERGRLVICTVNTDQEHMTLCIHVRMLCTAEMA